MKRKHFNRLIASAIGSAFLPKALFGTTDPDYPFQSLPQAFKALGFDASRKGNSFFVVTADVHYGTKLSDGMRATVEEVNVMNPLPSFFCVNGDMIVNGSRNFGTIPDAKARELALQEFRGFKSDAALLNPEIPLKLTLGNHDTHPGEVDPEMFWEIFPGYPPYQSFEMEGCHLILLNGHSTGYIDAVQLKWLKKDVAKISGKKNVIVFVHQPSMSRTVRERGIPEAIGKVFEKHEGLVWLIGGHEHTNNHKIFKLRNTHLIEHHITCGAINIWGGPEKPGYWIYCLRNGEVAGRIFRQRVKGYRIEPFPDVSAAIEVPVPFANLKGIKWMSMIGSGHRRFLELAKASDCLNYFAHVKELVYRIPLHNIKDHITQLALLTDHQNKNHNKPGQYFISSDKNNWLEIHPANAMPEVLLFQMDGVFSHGEDLYFKFTPSGRAAVAGIAAL